MIIRKIEEVEGLTSKIGTAVTFKINSLSDGDNKKWQNKFNALLNDCGCNNGKQYLFLLMPLVSLFLLSVFILTSISGFKIILIFLLATFLIGVWGKISGWKNRDRIIKITIEEFYEEIVFIE